MSRLPPPRPAAPRGLAADEAKIHGANACAVALRERPELQGKMVLEFTIAPSGEVTVWVKPALPVFTSRLNWRSVLNGGNTN